MKKRLPSLSPVVKLADYDLERLQSEWLRVRAEYELERQPTAYHTGAWQGVSLRGASGRVEDMRAGASALRRHRDTDAMRLAPYIEEILSSLPGPKHAVRLSVLQPDGHIAAHRNACLCLNSPVIRLHIPIVTNRDVYFIIDDVRVWMEPGSLWYGDFSRVHAVSNLSSELRVHLLIDCWLSDELLTMFPADYVDAHRGQHPPVGGTWLARRKMQLFAWGHRNLGPTIARERIDDDTRFLHEPRVRYALDYVTNADGQRVPLLTCTRADGKIEVEFDGPAFTEFPELLRTTSSFSTRDALAWIGECEDGREQVIDWLASFCEMGVLTLDYPSNVGELDLTRDPMSPGWVRDNT